MSCCLKLRQRKAAKSLRHWQLFRLMRSAKVDLSENRLLSFCVRAHGEGRGLAETFDVTKIDYHGRRFLLAVVGNRI